MNRLLYILPFIAVVLTACDDESERDCVAFNHPALNAWQPERGEATLTYTNPEGLSKVFNRQAIVLNEPFLKIDGSSNDEDVLCELTATVRMQATDNTLAITATYTQEEQFQLDEEDEILLLNHRVESLIDNELSELVGNYPVDISENRTRININPARIEYLEPEQITQFNGQAYDEAVRIYGVGRQAPEPETDTSTDGVTEPDNTPEANTDEPETGTDASTDPDAAPAATDVIHQIVVAKGVGILAFTDAQGSQFVLVPSN